MNEDEPISEPKLQFAADLWSAQGYLAEFYPPGQINPDEPVAMRAQIEFSQATFPIAQPDKPVVLEFGAGPTEHRAIAVVPYVAAIHIAEYLPHNLAESARWVDNREGRHDWDLYAAYALTCEGIPQPTAAQVADRLALTRAKMTRLMPAGAGREQPLGESAPPRYAHVYSGFCADSATGDKQTWRRFMRNIASLVAEGGTFWTAALHRATSYRAGRHRFPSANLDSADLQEILALDFLPQSIAVEVRALPQMREHGYAGIILASARKQRRCGS